MKIKLLILKIGIAQKIIFREASGEVFKVLSGFDSRIIVERASIDEAFLDLTDLVDYIISDEDPVQKVCWNLKILLLIKIYHR